MWLTKAKTAKPTVIESMLDLAYPVFVRRSSRRRSIELRVTVTGLIRVLCPLVMTDSQISAFIESKSSWIESKLRQSITRQSDEYVPSLEAGAMWRFRGQALRLKFEVGQGRVEVDDTFLTVYSDAGDARQTIEAWYFEQAEQYLLNRTNYYAEQMGLRPRKVQLKAYRSMWGRCNSRHEIAYDWRVIQAPDSVIDYLVIHELSHLRHFNHSDDFWNLVGSFQPSYQDSKAWLKANAHWVKHTFTSS
jgi:predicted metal-dependent hydrolase